MIGAGTIINPIIKIVTTVAVLAAIYFFMLKPILETSEQITGNITDSFPSLDGVDQQIENALKNTEGADSIDFETPKSAQQAQKLGDCMRKAVGDVEAVQRCADRHTP